jgi:hypothetical protein
MRTTIVLLCVSAVGCLATPLHRQHIDDRLQELSQSLLQEVQPGLMAIVQQPHAPLAARLEGTWTFLDEIFAQIRTHLKADADDVDRSWEQLWDDAYVVNRIEKSDPQTTVVFNTFLRILPSLQQTISERWFRHLSIGQQENFMVVWITTLKMIEHCIQPTISLTTIQHDAIVEMYYQSFCPVGSRAVALYVRATTDEVVRQDRNTRIRMAVNGIIHHLISTPVSNWSQIQANVHACGQTYRERSQLVPSFCIVKLVVGQLGLLLMMVGLLIVLPTRVSMHRGFK